MSGNIEGRARGLPFTGLGTLPLIVVGLVLSGRGWLMATLRPKPDAS